VWRGHSCLRPFLLALLLILVFLGLLLIFQSLDRNPPSIRNPPQPPRSDPSNSPSNPPLAKLQRLFLQKLHQRAIYVSESQQAEIVGLNRESPAYPIMFVCSG